MNMNADEFEEMTLRMADTVLVRRLRQREYRAKVTDTVHLYNAAGGPLRLTVADEPLMNRPRVVEAAIADHRAVAGVLVTETQTRATDCAVYPSRRVLCVMGVWPWEGLTVMRTWALRFGKAGWEMQQERSGPEDDRYGLWLWRLLPN